VEALTALRIAEFSPELKLQEIIQEGDAVQIVNFVRG
jgi:sulfur carrier protein ThiS